MLNTSISRFEFNISFRIFNDTFLLDKSMRNVSGNSTKSRTPKNTKSNQEKARLNRLLRRLFELALGFSLFYISHADFDFKALEPPKNRLYTSIVNW